MKKAKRIYALLGILAIACVATFVVSRQEEEKEKIKNSDEIILTIDTEAVTALSWEYDEVSLAFHKEGAAADISEEAATDGTIADASEETATEEAAVDPSEEAEAEETAADDSGETHTDGTWLYDEDENFPVDEEKIADLLEQFGEFGVSFEIEEVEYYAQYGLDDPVCTIWIATTEQQYTIRLGAYSTMDSRRYVSIGDGKVSLVNQDPMEDYEIELRDIIRHDDIPGLSDATAIRFAGTQNYEILYEEESTNTYCEEDVYFMEDKPLDSTTVSDYLSTVDGVGLTEYVSYNVTGEELAAFGLEEPDLTITVDYPVTNEEEEETTETFVLHLGRNQEELKAALETEDEDEIYSVTAYARVGDSQIVYEITSLEYKNLTENSYDDLRHKEVLTASFDDIYQIDITLEGESYTISSTTEDDVKTWQYGNNEELSISGLTTAVKALEAIEFTSEEPTDKEEIGLKVYLENENYPEITVSLYRYDGSECIAVVDGASFARVSRSDVVDLIEAVNAIILDKSSDETTESEGE